MWRTWAILWLALLGATASCSAAEPEKKPLLPAGTTNFFSDWIASSNLTVKIAGVPWRSSKSFVGSVGAKGRLKPVQTEAPIKPEVLEAIAQLHRRVEERRERENREKLLNGPTPALSDQYHVRLSRTPDHSTNAPAK